MMKMMKNWQVDRQRVTKWSSELKHIVLFILRASWNFHLKRTYILCYHSLYFLTIIIHHYQDDHWAYLKILSHSHLSPNSNLISSSSSVSPNPLSFSHSLPNLFNSIASFRETRMLPRCPSGVPDYPRRSSRDLLPRPRLHQEPHRQMLLRPMPGASCL